MSQHFPSGTGFNSRVDAGFSLITAEDRLTIMNVPERTLVTFFLPHSDTSVYTAIVSVNVITHRISAHVQCLESKHQGGVRYGNRAELDEDAEVIANRSNVAPGCCKRSGFFQGHEVFNGCFSRPLSSSFDLKTFHAVLCFDDIKPARSHTFRPAHS